jgi:hypothetical protein
MRAAAAWYEVLMKLVMLRTPAGSPAPPGDDAVKPGIQGVQTP